MVKELQLSQSKENIGEWVNSEGVVFQDPTSLDEISVGLCKKEILWDWLESNDYQLIWLVNGEKSLFTDNEWASEFYGRHNYSGFFKLTAGGIEGNVWFEKELP